MERSISFIIPAKNEERGLKTLLPKLHAHYADAEKTLELLAEQIPAPLLARFPYMGALDVESLSESIRADTVQGQLSSQL